MLCLWSVMPDLCVATGVKAVVANTISQIYTITLKTHSFHKMHPTFKNIFFAWPQNNTNYHCCNLKKHRRIYFLELIIAIGPHFVLHCGLRLIKLLWLSCTHIYSVSRRRESLDSCSYNTV